MKTVIDFKKEEYEKLIETLDLVENMPDQTDDIDYFNAWNFGLKEEDCNFIISASLPK